MSGITPLRLRCEFREQPIEPGDERLPVGHNGVLLLVDLVFCRLKEAVVREPCLLHRVDESAYRLDHPQRGVEDRSVQAVARARDEVDERVEERTLVLALPHTGSSQGSPKRLWSTGGRRILIPSEGRSGTCPTATTISGRTCSGSSSTARIAGSVELCEKQAPSPSAVAASAMFSAAVPASIRETVSRPRSPISRETSSRSVQMTIAACAFEMKLGMTPRSVRTRSRSSTTTKRRTAAFPACGALAPARMRRSRSSRDTGAAEKTRCIRLRATTSKKSIEQTSIFG